jgi:hypothetical protein
MEQQRQDLALQLSKAVSENGKKWLHAMVQLVPQLLALHFS